MIGVAGYAFIALAGNTLPPAEAAAVSSFYMLVNILGPGVFTALEQETNRACSSMGPVVSGLVVRRAAVRGGALLGAVLVVLVMAAPVLVNRSLLGHWDLFAAVVVSAVTAGAVSLIRGVLAGRKLFVCYAATLAAEGFMRLLPAVLIALAGLAAAGCYGIVFALGSGFGALAGLAWIRRTTASSAVKEPASSDPGALRRLVPLVGATVLAQLVANLAPVVVTARLPGETATAAAFASGFIIARIPLFLFSPIQAVVVPAVASAAANGDRSKVSGIVRCGRFVAASLGLAGSALMAAFGPWVLRTFFGTKAPVSGAVLGLLGLGTSLLILAQVLQAALVALRAHAAASAWWQIGAAVLVMCLALPGDPICAAVVGQVASSVVVVVGMLITLRSRLRALPIAEIANS
jgi:O-antigen/teichoic acid export membrane protein